MQKMWLLKYGMFLRVFSVLPESRKHCDVANGGNVFVEGWNVAMVF